MSFGPQVCIISRTAGSLCSKDPSPSSFTATNTSPAKEQIRERTPLLSASPDSQEIPNSCRKLKIQAIVWWPRLSECGRQAGVPSCLLESPWFGVTITPRGRDAL